MKNKKTFVGIALLILVLVLGIGYAAITGSLTIGGTAKATTDDDNFKVVFTGIPVVSESKYATASITDGINAKIDVTGLTQKGQYVTVTYDIVNNSRKSCCIKLFTICGEQQSIIMFLLQKININ